MGDNTNEKQKLKMSFDPQTIEHLGVKMYSQLPNAIAELISPYLPKIDIALW